MPVSEEGRKSAGDRSLLSLENVGKQYGANWVLRGVNIEVRRGEVMMLAGENGAGKSTLKNILAGLVVPDGGSLNFDGTAYASFTTADADRLGIGTIHQELSLFENLSVAENIFIAHLPQRAGALDRRRLRAKARELMDQQLGMAIDPDREVGSLSLGERQMVEIAKALSQSSSLIIFDEPTTCLSNPERQRLFGIIRRLKAQNYAIIYITHFMEEVYALGDRITVLRDGRVVGQGTVGEVPLPDLARLMVGREMSGSNAVPPDLPSGAPVLLEVEDLEDGASIHGVSFKLHSGEILGLGGLLGAGRSEVAEAIFGLRLARGTIKIAGHPFAQRSPELAKRRGLALVSEDRRLDQAFLIRPVRENVTAANFAALGRSALGWIRRRDEDAAALGICRKLQVLTAGLGIPMAALSGGNQQKAVIGRWLDINPCICILDEPTKGVDIGARESIHHLIVELARQGVAVLLISSDLPELLALSHRVIVLHKGHTAATFDRADATAARIIAAASTGTQQ